jgi:hypothetical protein
MGSFNACECDLRRSAGRGGGGMRRYPSLNMTLRPQDGRAQPALPRSYRRLRARVDRLEDVISHFYNVTNELRDRVSTLEKKLNPLAEDWTN